MWVGCVGGCILRRMKRLFYATAHGSKLCSKMNDHSNSVCSNCHPTKCRFSCFCISFFKDFLYHNGLH